MAGGLPSCSLTTLGIRVVWAVGGTVSVWPVLARRSKVHDKVTRTISGDVTPEMQSFYSTVEGHEVREGFESMRDLVGVCPGRRWVWRVAG